MPRKKKDYGEIKNYKVIDGGIWIPKEECQRLYELFNEKYEQQDVPGIPGLKYNVEGFRRLSLLYRDFAAIIEKGE